MPKDYFMRRIVERFLDEGELRDFVNRYEEAKLHRPRFEPTVQDWQLFDSDADIEKLRVKWGFKTKESVIRRLGQMVVLSKLGLRKS